MIKDFSKSNRKKFLPLFMAILMVFSGIPTGAFAEVLPKNLNEAVGQVYISINDPVFTPYEEALQNTLGYILNTVPEPNVGSVGGEWSIIALARHGVKPGDTIGGIKMPADYYSAYLERITEDAVENWFSPADSLVHNRKATDNERVAIALAPYYEDPITVTFRLIGDDAHDEGTHDAYKTWIATKSYSVSPNSKVSDVFDLALAEANLTATINYGYVSAITAPAVLGGYTLSEATFGEGPDATYAGWMFSVNDLLSDFGMSETSLAANDKIVFFYTDDMNDGIDWATNDASKAPALAAPDLDPVDETNAKAVADAKKYLEEETVFSVSMSIANTEAAIRTWLTGRLAVMPLSSVTISIGEITITPAIAGTSGNTSGTDGSFTAALTLSKGSGVTLVSDSAAISGKITATPYSSGGGNSINVSFRLIGAKLATADVNLSTGGYNGADYVTWIATKSYSLSGGSTVYDLFTRAIADAGLTALGQSTNYVTSITAPQSLGGYKLEEFTNGPYSGWMYTVNGKHVGYGLKEQALKNGDSIVWHYVNDYRHEVEDWFDDPNYPAIGDGTYWNQWLKAEDKNPSTNPGGAGSNPTATQNPDATTGGDDWQNPFSDVKTNDWFYEAVKYANENGLMQGVGDGKFAPAQNVTRAMIVTILYRAEGEPESDGSSFSDVKSSQWYTDAVAWASKEGIVKGYGNNLFGPGDNITREQFALILYNYAKWKELDVNKTASLAAFQDADKVSDWAKTALEWAVGAGLIQGRSEDVLAPKGAATRAEAAMLLMRFMELI